MKKLLLLIVLAGAGYYGWTRYNDSSAGGPEHIENPVYGELRVDAKAAGRELNMVMYGEMADEADCRERSARVWDDVLIAGCKECTSHLSACKTELEPRYRRMFDDQPTHLTYLSFTRGERGERSGRMIIYGLTNDEGDAICDALLAQFQTRYKGTVRCIRARRD